jgi:hypothetical protein
MASQSGQLENSISFFDDDSDNDNVVLETPPGKLKKRPMPLFNRPPSDEATLFPSTPKKPRFEPKLFNKEVKSVDY